MLIEEMKQEGRAEVTALITKCDKGRTAKGAPYLSILLEDRTGVLDCKWWNLTEEQVASWKPGMIVKASGDLIIHKNAIQFRLRNLEEVQGDVSLYARSAPMDKEAMKAEVQDLLNRMENERIALVTSQVIEDTGEDYYTYPAATRNHHNFVGGLAYHSLCMARAAKRIGDLYPFLDMDLLIAGILLHDLGKVEELSAPVLSEYTAAGNLVGHITMGAVRIDRAMAKLGFEEDEDLMLLKHMVLSHHGTREFGSPVVPMVPEAEMLSLLDNMDARMFMMKAAVDATVPGTFGPRVFALDNRMIYRRNEKEGSK